MLFIEDRVAVEWPNWELGSELIKLSGLMCKVLFIPSVTSVTFFVMSLLETKLNMMDFERRQASFWLEWLRSVLFHSAKSAQ